LLLDEMAQKFCYTVSFYLRYVSYLFIVHDV
jgi:hypothetical protein